MILDTSVQITILVILLFLSAFFSMSETALMSLSKIRVRHMVEEGVKGAKLVEKLIEDPNKLLGAILIGNNIVNIALASMGTVVFVKHFGDIGVTLSTIVITIAVLIFGEITPKSVAKDCPEQFAMFSAPIINMLIYILTPINFLFAQWKKLVAKVLKLESSSGMSQEELLMLVEEVQQEGSIDVHEGELLKNAIEFTEREAEDILTHRTDLEAVPVTAKKDEIAKKFSETMYSRLLVYKESIDDIVGVIHQKDFYIGSGITDKSLDEIMTPAVFVMKDEKISSLLKQLQKEKSHIAVVLDEYGGTYGIVTMEDILEELVGEIWDEHDEVDVMFKSIDNNTYVVDASADFEDFKEFFDIKAETEMVSVSGWISEMLGKIPEIGESFEYENLKVTVKEVDSHTVSFAEVIKKEKIEE